MRYPPWSSSYDTHADSKRLGFDPLSGHGIFSDHELSLIRPTVTFGDQRDLGVRDASP